MKRMLLISAGLVAGLLLAPAPGQTPQIRKGHPRIYVIPTDVPILRSRVSGVYSSLFAEFQKADWIMNKTPGNSPSDATNLPYPAFMYLIKGETKYRDKVKEFFEAILKNPPHDKFLAPEWIRAGCMALDWIWTDISATERNRYAGVLLDLSDWLLKNAYRHSDFSNQFVLEHLSVLYTGVLLHGEGIQTSRVKNLLDTGTNWLVNHAVPAANEIAGTLSTLQWPKRPALAPYLEARSRPGDPETLYFVGGQAEGFSYNDWGYARPLTLTTEMWRVATAQDLFQNASFFRGQSVWHAYGIRPDTRTFARSEDCGSGFHPGENLKSFIHLVASRVRDPLAEYLGAQIKWRYVQKAWKEMLWRDPGLEAKSPRDLGLPLAACFPKLGHVYFRNAWDNAYSAFALFQCGPFYAGHQHLDNNTFVLHRTGSLAIDSGTNDYTSHRGNYYCRTIAHNGVLVFDPEEPFSGSTWSPVGTGGSNDGGQMRGYAISRAGEFKPGCPSDTGMITLFLNSPFVAGCVGDATRAYSSKKVHQALRAFFHIRAPESKPGAATLDTFVVFDVLNLVKAKSATWVIHSLEKPKVQGNTFVITHNQGQLTGHFLVPDAPAITLVGGPGKESWVNGKNYPPVQKPPDPEAGAWRLEADIPAAALVVLYTQKKGAAAGPKFGWKTEGRDRVLRFRRGRLQYLVKLDRSLKRLPRIEVKRGARVVDRLEFRKPARKSTRPSIAAR